MGSLILGVNTSYRLFCFFKLFPMVVKGLTTGEVNSNNWLCVNITIQVKLTSYSPTITLITGVKLVYPLWKS